MRRTSLSFIALHPASFRRAHLLRTTALQAAVLLVLAPAAWAQPAPNSRPVGGSVVAGSASIARTPTATTINQSSQRAAIDWRSFDVGRDQTVQFQQPGASAIVLNRVTGPDPSAIAGRIIANGQVVITNQSGVTFHKGAQVDTAGLIVSAAGITPAKFMAGRMVFDQAPQPGAQITNAGTITVRDAGLAALVAPRVANSGVIQAKMGHVILAGAETHTLDLYGDGLLSIDITRQVQQAPRGLDGKPVTALVTNSGTIRADGGTVSLTAAAADGLVQTLVQAGGHIQANTAGGRTGTIILSGVGGSVQIDGRVAADGYRNSTGNSFSNSGGGTVVAQATGAVRVTPPARITANGDTAGGTIAIGTSAARVRGGTAVRALAAANVTVDAGARVTANARQNGRGGTIGLLSTGRTTVDGMLAARGGAAGGDGGAIEISGQTLAISGRINAGAPAGHVGRVLIDPADVTISDHGGPGTVITPATLQGTIGDVTVQATNSVVASSSVTLTGKGQSLTLDGGNLVRVDPGVTLDVTGGIILKAGVSGVSVLGSLNAPNGLTFNVPAGPVTQGSGSVITTSNVVGAVGSLLLDSPLNKIAALATTSFTLAAGTGDITVVSAVPLTVFGTGGPGVTAPAGRTISLTTDTLTLRPSETSVISVPGGTIRLQPLTVGRALELTSTAATADTLSIPAGSLGLLVASTLSLGSGSTGPITLAPDGTAIDLGATGFKTLILTSGSTIGQVGAIAVGTVGATGAAIDLSAAGNFLPSTSGLIAQTSALLHTGSTLSVDGPVTAPGQISLSSTGLTSPSMTLNANLTGGSVRLDTYDGTSLATSGAIIQVAGVIGGTMLTGQAGSAGLNQANQIPLGDFHTNAGFAFTGRSAIVLNGVLLNDAGVVRLTSAGPVTQGAGGTLQTPTLTGTAQSAALTNNTNLIGVLDTFTTTGGDFALRTLLVPGDGSALPPTPLSLAGSTTVPTGRTLSLSTDRVDFAPGSSLAAPAGTVAFAPFTAGRPIEVVGTAAAQSPAALSLIQANLLAIQTGTLQLGTATSGPIVLGTPGDGIDLTGRATTLSLTSAGAITQGVGATLTVPTLAASVGSVVLAGANRIDGVGPVTTTGVTTINSTKPLVVSGPILSGGAVSVGSAAGLTMAGAVSAPSIGLAAGAVGITQTAGLITTPGTLALATAGPITQTGGTITANTLAGVTGAITLVSAGNQIAALGPLTADGPVTINDGATALNLAGPVNAGTNALTLTTGNLTQTASVTAGTLAVASTGAITLNAADNAIGTLGNITSTSGASITDGKSLAVLGTLSDPASISLAVTGDLALSGRLIAAAVRLDASGAITEPTGAILATTLAGSAASASLNSAANRVATLGPFFAAGGFTLRDSRSLTIAGTIDPPDVTLTVAGDLAINAPIIGNTVTLNVSGAVTEGAGGRVTATTLQGSAATVRLDQPNGVSTLGSFASTSGFNLNDIQPLGAAQPLTVAGPVTDGTAIMLASSGPLILSGSVTAPLVSLTARAGTVFGRLTSGLPPTVLPGTITQTGGTVTATTGVSVDAAASVSQTGGAIVAGRLDGVSGGSTLLTQATNKIGTLANYSSAGGFTLTDGQVLSQTGTLTDTVRIGLSVAGGLSLAGTLTAPAIDLAATGAVSQSGGAITTTTLTGAAGSAAFGQAANAIVNLGGFSSAGAVSVTDGSPLTVTGAVSAGAGSTLALTSDRITLQSAGTLTASDSTIILAPLTPNAPFTLTSLIPAGTATGITASTLQIGNATAGSLLVNGPFVLPGVGTLSLVSGGAITEASGAGLTVGRLAASGTTVRLDQANTVGTLGASSALGAFTLANGAAPLTIGGPVVSIGALSIAAGSIAIGQNPGAPATLMTPGLVTLTASGGISELNGSISAAALTATGSNIALIGVNRVSALTGLAASAGSATFANQGALTVGGPVSAPNAVVLQAGGPMTLGTPSSIAASQVTLTAAGLLTVQGGTVVADSLAAEVTGSGSRLVQTGTTNVAAFSARPVAVRLTVHGGSIALDNLVAPGAALTLSMDGGSATGTLNVGNLLIADRGGSATLLGRVAGQDGFAAAIASKTIHFDTAYTLNGCAIAATTCVAIPPVPPPVLPPKTPVSVVKQVQPSTIQPDRMLIESLLRPDRSTADLLQLDIARDAADPGLALPNISDRDY